MIEYFTFRTKGWSTPSGRTVPVVRIRSSVGRQKQSSGMAPGGRCLYEILDVARDVEEDAIKKAYRRQALIWHPGACVRASP